MRIWKMAAATVLLGMSGLAQAALVDRGGGLIYDDVLNITWLGDANYAKTSGYMEPDGTTSDGLFGWKAAVDWAEQLEYGGYSDWRLASMSVKAGVPTGSTDENAVVACNTASEVECRDNELGYMHYYNMRASLNQSILAGSNTDYLALFKNIQNDEYHSGTVYNEVFNDPLNTWYFNNNGGYSQTASIMVQKGFHAWAVRDGDVSVVPLPAAAWLLLSGLGGLGLLGRRRAGKAG